MEKHALKFVDTLPADVLEAVSLGHEKYETSQGVICGYKEFSILSLSEAGTPLGVLSGYTAYAEIYVDDLWVDEHHRKRGLGRQMLLALEERFHNMGFDNINCVTNQFQAVGFYTKCGFEIEFVRPNQRNPKLTKTFLIKYLNDK